LAQAQLPASALSAMVLPIGAGPARLSRGADQALAPASTMKLLTTVVALDELGPAFRWRTQLLAQRAVTGSNLRGPLYLRGGGDPDLTWQKLQLMLRSLRAQGVRHLRGDIVLDRSYFAPERPDLGVAQFDESPDAYYNVVPDALLLGSNLLEMDLHSDAHKIKLQLRTPLAGVQLHSRQTLIDADCISWDDGWRTPELHQDKRGVLHVTLLGSFPRNCAASTSSNIVERNLFVERSLRALWRELGGSWIGGVRDGLAPTDAQLLVEQSSDTLADIVKQVNKRSDNAMARTLFLTLGAQYADRSRYANHLEAAQARIRDWLDRHQIASTGLVLDNGSGLSRSERITPQQLAQVLRTSAASLWSAELVTSLPIAGLDGSMRRRLKDTPAALRSRIKTGSLRDVAAIAGYVRDLSGKDWIVVAIINAPDAKRGRAALDALIAWVASTATTTTAAP
jgi:D-alanyl-D-alanine carboxypeptidase/D-alanyl-D-alanine-endopeptidase (penicillin-binding protein 4)